MLNEEEITNWDGYSDWVEGKISTQGDTRLFENCLGLAGETGEVLEKIKKLVRDPRKTEEDPVKQIKKELGDVLFYVTALGNYYGVGITDIMRSNVEKLNSRQLRGVLAGSGDNR